jgi:hypothetical protein
MSDLSSCHLCSRKEKSMSSSIAMEAQQIVRSAATPVPPGETIKGQLRRAARALGYRDGDWRVRAAWYGEAASWSASAFEELRERHRSWNQKQARLADLEQKTLAATLAAFASQLEAEKDAGLSSAQADGLRRLADQLRDVSKE